MAWSLQQNLWISKQPLRTLEKFKRHSDLFNMERASNCTVLFQINILVIHVRFNLYFLIDHHYKTKIKRELSDLEKVQIG